MMRSRHLAALLAAALVILAAPSARAQLGETLVEAALNEEGSGRAYFFLGDQYAIYDWAQDRAISGTHPITDFGFPPSFAPLGLSTRLDTAMGGKAAYAGFAYFFKGAEYIRFQWSGPRGLNPAFARPLSLWNLPGNFNLGVDASFNGRHSREGKGYFFRGDQYVRYDWPADRPDPGYPLPIANLVGMPAFFTTGVDAAVDGDGPYVDVGYLFKRDQYVRFTWDPGGTNPRVDGGMRPIHQIWPGLAELLLAGKAKTQASEWLQKAKGHLIGYIGAIESGIPSPFNEALTQQALATHFHIAASRPHAERVTRAREILATYTKVETTFNESPRRLRFRTDAEAQTDPGGWDAASSRPHHAYAFFGGTINVSRLFPTDGPLARAAQFLHETVHVIDSQSGSRTTHIPEWYVTEPEAARLGLVFAPDTPALTAAFAHRYDRMTYADALHNPSAYAAFAQHVTYGVDTRYGAGKPTQ
jgi:hypothetical protein